MRLTNHAAVTRPAVGLDVGTTVRTPLLIVLMSNNCCLALLLDVEVYLRFVLLASLVFVESLVENLGCYETEVVTAVELFVNASVVDVSGLVSCAELVVAMCC